MQSQPPRFVFDFIRFINSSPSVDRLYALRYSIERNDQEIKELQERLKNLELNRELDLQDYDTLIRKLNADMEVAIDLEKDRFYAEYMKPEAEVGAVIMEQTGKIAELQLPEGLRTENG